MRSSTRRQLLLLLGIAAATTAVCPPTLAHPPRRPRPSPPSRYSIQLEDVFGRRLPTYLYRGQSFVLGRWGDRYQVRIRNDTPRRVEAVVTVDGRDVISGKNGAYTQRGYIVPPYGSVVVTGFRQSLDRVAAFRFTDPFDSYSARMGTPENVGVVGVAFFPERARWEPEPEYWRRPTRPTAKRHKPRSRAAEGAPSDSERHDKASRRPAPHAESRGNLGTEYGETTTSHAVERTFERAHAHSPDRVLVLRYDDAEGLRSRGIRLWHDEPVPHVWDREPDPFPERRFAPPPP